MGRYIGIAYGKTFAASTGYSETEWARCYDTAVFDYSILGEAAFNNAVSNAGISAAHRAAIALNALKYMDIWGRSAYANAYDWGALGLGWDKGPSAAGDPSLYAYGDGTGTTVYGYRMTDRHCARFLGWIENAMRSAELPCKGVFLDDFLGGRQHWTGADRPKLWGAMNGRAGYDSDAYDWNLPRLNLLISRLAEILPAIPGDKLVLCNSGHSASYTGPERAGGIGWMIEGYQRWFTRTYLRGLMDSGEIKAGDVLVLQGRTWDAGTESERWADLATGDPEVTNGGREDGDNYEEIWAEAQVDAEEYDLKIALGWTPSGNSDASEHATAVASGGLALDSGYSCLTDPSTLE